MYINYSTFVRLYNEAEREKDLDMYIAERGWQDWMGDDVDDVIDVLRTTYEVARSDFKELREMRGISQADMIRTYNIPARTLKQWEYGEREPAEHVRKLLAYAVTMETLNKENEDGDTEEQD